MSERTRRVTRRSFGDWLFRVALPAAAGLVLYPVARFLMPPKVKDVAAGSFIAAKVGEIQPNAAKIFLYGGKPAILVNRPQGNYKAFSAVCTHLACTVQYRQDLEHIWCACHNGHYDPQNGQVLGGPPPRPLPEYGVVVKGNDIVVTRSA